MHRGLPLTPIAERVWKKVTICEHSITCPYCCWPWQGRRDESDHGRIDVKTGNKWKQTIVSRVIWEMINKRPMPQGFGACHHCSVAACCNPWHLYPGTQLDNMRDAKRLGRVQKRRGEESSAAKLTNEAIAVIWEMRRQDKSPDSIAELLQVSRSAIDSVLMGRTWGEISPLYNQGLGPPGKLRGDKHSQAKLKSADIPLVWQWHREGQTMTAIARRLHVTRNAIGSVLRYETWKHVSLLLKNHQLSKPDQ